MKSILLVCTGNTCRSSMAEALLRRFLAKKGLDASVTVSSAGTHAVPNMPANPSAREVMDRVWQVDTSGHFSTPLTPEIIASADLILTMTDGQRQVILALVPQVSGKVFRLSDFAGESGRDVSDPIGYGPEVYEQVAEEIARYLQQGLPRMLELLKLEEDDNA